MIVKIIRSLLPKFVFERYIKRWRDQKAWNEWKSKGCPVPPPHIVKQLTIIEYQEKFKYNILVETGTYLGEMVAAQRKNFNTIYSIELGVALYKKAKAKFKNNKNVIILQGDSGKVLPHVLSEINEPAIFWLDGHYSAGITAKGDKECPIFEELDAIFHSRKFNHIILIDDARCFTGVGDYPTIEKLTEYVKEKQENYQVEVKHDIIRFTT